MTEEATPAGHVLGTAQCAFFIAYAAVLVLWLLSEYLHFVRRKDAAPREVDLEIQSLLQSEATNGQPAPGSDASLPKATVMPVSTPATGPLTPSKLPAEVQAYSSGSSLLSDMAKSSFIRCLTLDCNAIYAERATLRAMFEFGTLMVWYFICDRTDLLASAGKSYSRDLFLLLMVILTIVAFTTSLQPVKQNVVLVRQQTEEWKGWMQVLFLLYHYFEAKELYNAIRLFIAAYVWMTGFGNFLYYYKTNDYSIGRFSQMMWRLNFLVFFACVVLRNSYMLYYICPMHTIFTVMVYGSLGIAYHLNKSDLWLFVKLLCCLASVFLLWEMKPVFYAVWSPFVSLMGYTDPRKPGDDPLYEWFFRSSLDRYIWIYGMLCGYLHPRFSSMLTAIDALPSVPRIMVRNAILLICGGLGYLYYTQVYCLPKLEYNKVHPFTSWIPITLWIVVRNMTPSLRMHHLRLYGWLGCITLETYICQFHIWMKTEVPDGQPKALLSIIPGYPLLNFALVTAGYIFVSHRLFELTNTLKNAAVPHNNNGLLLRNTLLLGSAGLVLYIATWGGLRVFAHQVL